MSAAHNPYSLKQLAPGSYDVLLYGIAIASLVRSIGTGGQSNHWEVELLDELPPVRWPAPFMSQCHTFPSFRAAVEWLGIGKDADEATNRFREQVRS